MAIWVGADSISRLSETKGSPVQTLKTKNPDLCSNITALKNWFSQLPLDPEQNVVRIQASLEEQNSKEMTVDDRLDLLECYREPVTQLLQDLQKHRVGLMLPLPRASLKTADLLRRLFQQYAQGYSVIIREITTSTGAIESDTDRARLMKACYGAILNFSQVLRCSYESYRMPPPGIWKVLHKVFRLALSREIETEEFDGYCGEPVSISNEYKRTLLMGLSEPYQLPFRAVNLVFDRLQQWSTLAQLQFDTNKESSTGCLFIVDMKSDLPAAPCMSSGKIRDPARDLILDTSPLVNALNSQLQNLTSEAVTDHGIEVTDFELIETLKALITHWRVHPIRRGRRSASNNRWMVILGLTNICRELADGADPAKPNPNRGDPRQMLMGTFGQQQYINANSRILPHPWTTVDESANGVRFRVENSNGVQVGVGELIAFRPAAGKSAWIVGVIRWAKESVDNTVDLGVYKLGEKTAPVEFRLASEKGQDETSKDYFGLFLPADASIKREQTLIIQSGLYGPKRQLWLRSKGKDYIVEASNLILAGRPFDWFEIRTNRGYGLTRDTDYNTIKSAESVYCPL